MPPLVSILIPAYNAETWIGPTIRSALSQTWPDKEIIVVDDGSKDDTLRVAKTHESDIVKVISQRNGGACAARNTALERSRGEYIQWLDADDLLHPAKISEQMRRTEGDRNPRVLLTSSFGTFYYRPQAAKFRPNVLWRDLRPVDWIFHKLNDNAWMNPAVWLVSRELSDSAGPWDERLSLDDDGEYICRVASVSEKVKFAPEAICYYRIGNAGSLNSDRNRSDRNAESACLSACLQIKTLLGLEDSERTRSAGVRLLQSEYSYYFPEKTELLRKAGDLARELGGELVPQELNWKNEAARRILGWKAARRAQLLFAATRTRVAVNIDKMLYLLDR